MFKYLDKNLKCNYHTHIKRCRHADGCVEDYIAEAIKEGYKEIAISDHMPHPGKYLGDNYRMEYADLKDYFNEVREAQQKFGDVISIKTSLECEYFRDYGWFYKELRENFKVDFLILGVHFYPYKDNWLHNSSVKMDLDHLKAYVDYVVDSIKSGYFDYLAHPDLFGVAYKDWDVHTIDASREILKAVEEMKIPIEININGTRRAKVNYNNGVRYQYPIKEFWELSKEYNVKRIIGIDAHNPKDLKDYKIGQKFAIEVGIDIVN